MKTLTLLLATCYLSQCQEIVLLRTYVSTNLISAGFYGSSSPYPFITTNGFLSVQGAMNADYVLHPPVYKVVTNYVLGTREIDTYTGWNGDGFYTVKTTNE